MKYKYKFSEIILKSGNRKMIIIMEEKKMDKEIEIDLIPILKAIVSKIWLMILVGAIFAGIAFGATKVLIKPTYRCSFTAYVNNQSAKIFVFFFILYPHE